VAFLGASTVQDLLGGKFPLSMELWKGLEYVLIIAGALVLLSPVEWFFRQRVRRWSASLGRDVTARYATVAEVDAMYQLCASFYDREDHVVNRDSLKAFMQANPQTVKVFSRKGQDVGIYIVFALNKDGARKLLDGSIRSAQALNSKHAVRAMRWAYGLYVTNICARGSGPRGMIVRGKVLGSLKEDVRKQIESHRSIRYVFARMANANGGRLIRKYGFTKTLASQPDEQVWKREIALRLPED